MSTDRLNTVSLLGQAYSLLGFKIVDGVVGAGYPQMPKHSAVFAQIDPKGSRLTTMAARANMTPQAMGELVDDLVDLGYVERKPDPTDGRAKLIMLTKRGRDCVASAQVTIAGIEEKIAAILGEPGRRELRRMLFALLTARDAGPGESTEPKP